LGKSNARRFKSLEGEVLSPDVGRDDLLLYAAVSKFQWPASLSKQDVLVKRVLSLWEKDFAKEFKKRARNTMTSGDVGCGGLTAQGALLTWKKLPPWSEDAFLQDCIDLYYHGIYLPTGTPKHSITASEVGLGQQCTDTETGDVELGVFRLNKSTAVLVHCIFTRFANRVSVRAWER
jgi:hypothetical protein